MVDAVVADAELRARLLATLAAAQARIAAGAMRDACTQLNVLRTRVRGAVRAKSLYEKPWGGRIGG